MSLKSLAGTFARHLVVVLTALLVVVLFPILGLFDAVMAFARTYAAYSNAWYAPSVFSKVCFSFESFGNQFAEDWWALWDFVSYDVPAAWSRV